MDFITQGLFGAAVGEAVCGHKLGRRATLWGAFGGLLPDLDVFASSLMGPTAHMTFHRGPTHALWFGPVVGTMLGYAVWWRHASRRAAGRTAKRVPENLAHPAEPEMLRWWIALFVVAIFTHPLLDLFTTYGTQLLAPFSDHRFALDALPIVDVFYSSILIVALVAARVYRTRSPIGQRVCMAAIAIIVVYTFYGLSLNGRAEAEARRQLEAEGIEHASLRCYPTLFQPYLRRVVVRTGDEIRVGYLSMWKPGPIRWNRVPIQTHPLIEKVLATREGQVFLWFAMGEVAPNVRESEGRTTVELADIRYGLPGMPEEGLWGLKARFGPDGDLLERPRRFSRPRRGMGRSFSLLWKLAFGRSS